MKKHYILGLTLITAIGFLALQRSGVDSVEKYLAKNGHTKFAAGAPAGKTGAPGEGSCIDCHSTGTVQDGSSLNNLLVLDGATPMANYAPGASYNVTLALNSGDVMEGFQATVLDVSTNSMAGSFPGTGGFGTAVSSGSGRDYANHTATSNTEGNLLWSWTWDAPATDMGPVRFYVATNVANGNGATSGDVIYLSEHTLGSSVGLNDEVLDASDFTAGYAANGNNVKVNFNSLAVDNMFFNLVDLSGKSVFTSNLGESKIGNNEASVSLPSGIKSGIYVVNFFVGNKAMSSKIMIQK
jgi:hypothetical protein